MSEQITVREACRRGIPLGGADAQALEGALAMTERERDTARSDLAHVTAERDALRAEVEAMREVESDARRVVDHWRDGLGMIGPVTSLRSDLDALDALRTRKGGG